MGRLSYRDYLEMAQQHNLAFKESMCPRSERTPCNWVCQFCGTPLLKSYRNLRDGKFPCRCQNGVGLTEYDYLALAHALKIEWIGSVVPMNTRTSTEWKAQSGAVVAATYAQLKYFRSKELFRKLGIEVES